MFIGTVGTVYYLGDKLCQISLPGVSVWLRLFVNVRIQGFETSSSLWIVCLVCLNNFVLVEFCRTNRIDNPTWSVPA